MATPLYWTCIIAATCEINRDGENAEDYMDYKNNAPRVLPFRVHLI